MMCAMATEQSVHVMSAVKVVHLSVLVLIFEKRTITVENSDPGPFYNG